MLIAAPDAHRTPILRLPRLALACAAIPAAIFFEQVQLAADTAFLSLSLAELSSSVAVLLVGHLTPRLRNRTASLGVAQLALLSCIVLDTAKRI